MKDEKARLVINAIRNVFPDQNPATLNLATRLGEIHGWDSMNAVNLQIELETRLNDVLLSFVVTEDLTIGDVVRQIS